MHTTICSSKRCGSPIRTFSATVLLTLAILLSSPSTLASCAHQDLAVVTAAVSPPYEPSLPSLTGMRLWSLSLKFLVTTMTAATPQRSFVADWLLSQGLLTQALYFTRVFVLSAQVSVLKKRPSLCSHRCCAENRPLKFFLT